MYKYRIYGSSDFYAEVCPRQCIIDVWQQDLVYKFESDNPPSFEIKCFGQVHTVLFTQAQSVYIREAYSTEVGGYIRIVYSDFYINSHRLSIAVETSIHVHKDKDAITFEFEVTGNHAGGVQKVYYPQSVFFDCEGPSAYTVLPMMQGTLIPAKWKNTVVSYSGCRYYERDAYMPWWGQVSQGSAYQCICETPWDGGYDLDHVPNGNTRIQSVWYPSLGKMSYRRKCVFLFFPNGSYNDFCAAYRQYVTEQGRLVTLKEKIQRNPKLAQRIGRPIVHDYLFVSIEKDSPMYRKRAQNANEYYYTFEQRWKQIIKLLDYGAKDFVIHLDGFGNRGYDNSHPDIFPVNSKIGGTAAMQNFAKLCRKHNLQFDVHDQYRDFYYNSPSFMETLAIHDSSRNLPVMSQWQGGKQTFLCAEVAIDFLRRNLKLFQDNNLDIDGLHLGSLAGDTIDECFNPLHPMSKRDCIAARMKMFSLLHSKGLLVSSDEPVDCFLPLLDSVSHAPYSLSPSLWSGVGNGIPIPLFNLVYHDCILIYWNSYCNLIGCWGIPINDLASSHATLNANPLYLSIDASKNEIEQCEEICGISKKLAFEQMIKHEFIDNNYRVQRTTFSDGTEIEVNFDSREYKVSSADK